MIILKKSNRFNQQVLMQILFRQEPAGFECNFTFFYFHEICANMNATCVILHLAM